MNDTTAPDAGKRDVEKIDFSKPFAIIFSQTAARNHFELISGHDCMAKAQQQAAFIALNQERPVAIFGPQIAVKIPPAEPQADDMELSFQNPPAVMRAG